VIETSTSEIRLWSDAVPGSGGWAQDESAFDLGDGEQRVRNVVVPTLTPFLPDPDAATGAGVIVAPGGGFFMLSIELEGSRVAEWLQARGVAAFVLKYRLLNTGRTMDDFRAVVARLTAAAADRRPGEGLGDQLRPALENGAGADGIRALELVRENAAAWRVAPGRLGFMGFSAGAFLATHVTAEAPAAGRPDFLALIYGGHAPGPAAADAPPLFAAGAATGSA